MIVEIFGMPGVGKSYMCKKIEEKKYANDVMLFYRENILGKVLFHLFLYFCLLNKRIQKKYNQICEIIGDTTKYNNILNSNVKIELYVKYMLFVEFIERIYKNKNIIIDEGIIHYSIALNAEFSLEFDKIEKIIKLFNLSEQKVIIGLICDKKVAINQMQQRNRKSTALDFLNEIELEKLLEKYIDAQNYFSKYFKMVSVKELEGEIKKVIKNDKV